MARRKFRKSSSKRKFVKKFRSKKSSIDTHRFQRHGYGYDLTWTPSASSTPVTGSIQINGLSSIDIYDSIRGSATPQNISCSGASELTALFDRYQVKGVKVTFIPRFNNLDTGSASNYLPVFSIVEDRDDAVIPPSGASEILERSRVKTLSFRRKMSFFIRSPSVTVQTYNALASSYTMIKAAPMLDTATATVPHYGFKYMVTGGTDITIHFDVKVTWYLKMKNVR